MAALRAPESRSHDARVLCRSLGRARAPPPRRHPASGARSPQARRIPGRTHGCRYRVRVRAAGDGDPARRLGASGRVAAHSGQPGARGPQARAATRARGATTHTAPSRTSPSAPSRRRARAGRCPRVRPRIRWASAWRGARADLGSHPRARDPRRARGRSRRPQDNKDRSHSHRTPARAARQRPARVADPPRGPVNDVLVFPGRSGAVWADDAWRYWRRRVFTPAVQAEGLASPVRPYDLRHSFVSLLLAEGANVVEIARQAGHSPTMTLSTYAHLFDETAGAERVSAEDQIRRARQLVRRERRTRSVPEQSRMLRLWEDEEPANRGEPTPGLEPGTPSLRVKCSTS